MLTYLNLRCNPFLLNNSQAAILNALPKLIFLNNKIITADQLNEDGKIGYELNEEMIYENAKFL